MSLDQTLDALRELGVYIPDTDGWDDAQLTRLGKLLCPWTLTIEPVGDLFMATTRKGRDNGGEVVADSSAEAAMELVLQHLEGKRYSPADTQYKQNAMRFRANNPN